MFWDAIVDEQKRLMQRILKLKELGIKVSQNGFVFDIENHWWRIDINQDFIIRS